MGELAVATRCERARVALADVVALALAFRTMLDVSGSRRRCLRARTRFVGPDIALLDARTVDMVSATQTALRALTVCAQTSCGRLGT